MARRIWSNPMKRILSDRVRSRNPWLASIVMPFDCFSNFQWQAPNINYVAQYPRYRNRAFVTLQQATSRRKSLLWDWIAENATIRRGMYPFTLEANIPGWLICTLQCTKSKFMSVGREKNHLIFLFICLYIFRSLRSDFLTPLYLQLCPPNNASILRSGDIAHPINNSQSHSTRTRQIAKCYQSRIW